MAIVIKVLVLVATDDPLLAKEAVFAAVNSGVFESASPIIDFALGFEQVVDVDLADYLEGQFVAHIPSAQLLETVNSISLPI